MTFNDTTLPVLAANATYTYRVAAVNPAGLSAYAVAAPVLVPGVPIAPSNLVAAVGPSSGNSRSMILTWQDNSTNETGFTLQRASNPGFTGNSVTSVTLAANATTYTLDWIEPQHDLLLPDPGQQRQSRLLCLVEHGFTTYACGS